MDRRTLVEGWRRRVVGSAIVLVACGSDGATSGGAADTTSTTSQGSTGSLDSGSADGASSSESGGTPIGCNSPAPDAWGGYNLDLGDFPGADAASIDLTIDCTIVAVTVNAATQRVEHDLECLDDGGAPHSIGFDVAVSHDGPDGLAAMVELPAQLRVVGVTDFGGVIEGPAAGPLAAQNIALVGDDGEVHAFVVDSYAVTPSVFAPITIEVDRDACGMDLLPDDPDFPGPDRDMAVTISAADQSTTLHSGQYDVLVVRDGPITDHIAIDVVEATAIECCETNAWISLVGRTYREYAPD